jgi:DNA-binding response OmpR family regulator
MHSRSASDLDLYSYKKVSHSSTKTHVIIVDLNSEEVLRLHGFLSRHAFLTDLAQTARELEKSFSEVDYDIVILGAASPDTDGLAILQWLTSMEHRPGILVRSGTDDEVDRIVTLELGA